MNDQSETSAEVESKSDSKPGLPILTPKNFFDYKEKMYDICLAKHGRIGKILSDNAYPTVEPVEPPADLEGVLAKNYTIADEGSKAAYLKRVEQNVMEIAQMQREKVRMFGSLMGTISLDSRQKLQEDANWMDIREACDPLELWLLILKTHLVQATGLKSSDRKLVRDEYNGLKQGTSSIAEHSQAFINSAKKLDEVGVVISEEDIAADYLASLDDGQYGMLKATVRRNALQGIKTAPATLKEAVTLAIGWRMTATTTSAEKTKVPESVVTTHPTSVFLAKNRPVGQTKGPQCYLCKKDHRVMDCPRMDEAAAYIAGKEERTVADKKIMFAHSGFEIEDPDAVVF